MLVANNAASFLLLLRPQATDRMELLISQSILLDGGHVQHGIAEDDPVEPVSVAAIRRDERQEPVVRANLHLHRDNAVFGAELHAFQLQPAIDKDPNIPPIGRGLRLGSCRHPKHRQGFALPAHARDHHLINAVVDLAAARALPEVPPRDVPPAIGPTARATHAGPAGRRAWAIVSTVQVYLRHWCGTLVSLGDHCQTVSHDPLPPQSANM